jgi:hypothetical protein
LLVVVALHTLIKHLPAPQIIIETAKNHCNLKGPQRPFARNQTALYARNSNNHAPDGAGTRATREGLRTREPAQRQPCRSQHIAGGLNITMFQASPRRSGHPD